jgi:hypothetical protein
MEICKFGDYKSKTTKKKKAKVFGIQTPKDDIHGSIVKHVYWNQNDIDRIIHYCQKDVVTLTQVLLRYHCEPLIKPENISSKYVQPG